MSKWDKLIQRIKALDKDIRFEEIKKVLEYFGYEMTTSGGSHCTFRKKGCRKITIPRHNAIKTIYIQLVKEIVEKEEKRNENS